MEQISIIDATIEDIRKYGVCGYKNAKTRGFSEKVEWLGKRFPEGLKIKLLLSEKDGAQGMIEYLPGETCWRPVNAGGYMFIHCVFVGFKKAYKNKGHATRLIEECEKDAKKQKMNGVAVMCRKGSFMAGKEVFVKNGYQAVDSAKPDYELLVKKFRPDAPSAAFKTAGKSVLERYAKGLFIIRADQCPYTVKNVSEIRDAAETEYGIGAKVIHLANYKEAQKNPCPFGTFGILYNGVLIADSPISKGRIVNILKKLKG
jgi:hypothetical protein